MRAPARPRVRLRQGYFFARPLDDEAAGRLIESGRVWLPAPIPAEQTA